MGVGVSYERGTPVTRPHALPAVEKLGTYKTGKVKFWPWRLGESASKLLKVFPLRAEAMDRNERTWRVRPVSGRAGYPARGE